MRIRDLDIPVGAILAPMAGISCLPFRRVCLELGAAFGVTELVSADAILRSAIRHQERVERAPGERILVGQVLGRTPEQFAAAAMLLEQGGCDVVDLNFGCPARKVVKTGGGAVFTAEPSRIAPVVRAVASAVSVPVTAKIRAGWETGRPTAVEAARAAAGEGAAAIFVHGRYREQVHSGPVHLDVIAQVKAAVAIPVIGNGGIASLADAERMIDQTGCDAVMIGQAAGSNPWLFREIATSAPFRPSWEDRLDLAKTLLGYYLAWAGSRRTSLEMRKYAAWLVRGMPGATAFRKRLGEVTSPEVLLDLLEALRAQIATGETPN